MLRHIAWFNEAPIAPCAGGLTSTNERVRRRCLEPARAIESLGVGCSVFGNMHDADPVHVSRHLQKLNADIVVIGEISGRERLQLARAAKHLGCYVVVDFGAEEKDAEVLHQLMQVADQAVAATSGLAAKIERETGMPAAVIPDGVEKTNGPRSIEAIAKMWLDCFMRVKLKPSAGANTNLPEQA